MAAQTDPVNQSTQSKYRKVRKSTDQPAIEENEVRITTSGRVKKYVDYALRLLEGGVSLPKSPESEAEAEADDKPAPSRKFDKIILKATGRAINHAVTSAEVVKRRVGGLHQQTKLETLEIEDVWEPTEEGLKEVKTTRRVASITIILSRDEAQIDKGAPGYQVPIIAELVRSGGRPFRGGPRRPRYPRRDDRGDERDDRRDDRPRRGGRRNDNRRQRGGGRRGGGGGRRGGNRRDERDDRDDREPQRSPRGGGRRGGGRRGPPRDDRDERDNRGPPRDERRSPRGAPRRRGPPRDSPYNDERAYQGGGGGGGGGRRRGGRGGGRRGGRGGPRGGNRGYDDRRGGYGNQYDDRY